MKPSKIVFGLGVLTILHMLLCAVGNAEANSFILDLNNLTIIDIGEISVQGGGVNNLGQVAGYDVTGGVARHAVLWENGVVTDLGTLGGVDSRSDGINSSGQIVGASSYIPGNVYTRAFLWQNGVMSDLGTLGGIRSWATGINDLGQISGLARTSEGNDHAVLWQNGQIKDLGVLPGDYGSYAQDVNNIGQVVGDSFGYSNERGYFTRGFIWKNGVMTELPTLGGNSAAIAINDVGQIIGFSDTVPLISVNPFPAGWERHAVLWENGNIIDLGLGGNSYVYDINNLGWVVGYNDTEGFPRRGFLWRDGVTTYLEDLFPEWKIMAAYAINDSGLIVGDWYPVPPPAVPEPLTIMLLGIGLVGLAGYGRRNFIIH